MAIAAAALLTPAGAATADDRTKPVVVDSGGAPDGSRYQHTVFARRFEGRYVDPRTKRVERFETEAVCKALRWPGRDKRGGGYGCEGPGGPEAAHEGVGVRFVQPGHTGEGVAQPDVVISGQTGARVARVEVTYRDLAGNERQLPVDFARVTGSRLNAIVARLGTGKKGKKAKRLARKRARGATLDYEAYGVFTAFLPGADAARDQLAARAAAGDRQPGQPPLGDPAWTGDLGGLSLGGSRCDERDGWFGPFRVVAFDSAGRALPDPRGTVEGCS